MRTGAVLLISVTTLVCGAIAFTLFEPRDQIASVTPSPTVKPPALVERSKTAPPPSYIYSPSELPTGREAPVEMVNNVELHQPADALDTVIIRAAGIVSSEAWTNPTLVPMDEDGADITTKTFKFMATPPIEAESRSEVPIYVLHRVEGLAPEVRTIRIVSSSTELTIPFVRRDHLAGTP